MNPDLSLRDIHLPPDPGWWPPAPGWWILLLLVFVLLGWLYLQLKQRRRSAASRRSWRPVITLAREELSRIEQAHQHEPQQMLREVSALLRRTAISLHGRQRISGLTGMAWLRFLDEQGDGQARFAHFPELLTEQPYRPDQVTELVGLLQTVRQWLHHQESRYV